MTEDARSERRFRCRIPVAVLGSRPGDEIEEYLTSDVSASGAFVRCDAPPPLQATIGLRLLVPPREQDVRTRAVVVHALEPEVAFGATPGFGVRFVDLDPASRRAWDEFLDYLEKAHPETAERAVHLAPKNAPDRVRRRHARQRAEIRVHLQTLDALRAIVTEDISRGGVFLRTPQNATPGELARVHIVHPRSREVFALDGVIARVERGARVGVAVQFTDITEEMRDALMAFVGPLLAGVGAASGDEDEAHGQAARSPRPPPGARRDG